MWESFSDLLTRNSIHRFPKDLLKPGIIKILLAPDYLLTKCKLVPTDIKADNILMEIDDEGILDDFIKAKMEAPLPRKSVDDTDTNTMTVYASRRFGRPRVFGLAVLGDFGSAVPGDEGRYHNAQPRSYRSPEVLLEAGWGYPVDIWNVGTMIRDLFERNRMFYGNDPDGKGYLTRAHLSEVMNMLGPPPLDLLKRGKRSNEFFTEDGQWKHGDEIQIPQDMSLEKSEEFLEGQNKEMFLAFMKKMFQRRPEDRKTAKELFKDPWLNNLD